jgi:FkbM family methyltransferase
VSARIVARQFDLVELTSITIFVALCAWSLARTIEPPAGTWWEYTSTREVARLKAAYGPSHYSENREEWAIRDFFKDRRNGVFVDVGANHYRDRSNTFFLEERLGWSGIAIDPQRSFEADYQKYRPRTRFFPLFVSDVSNETAKLYVADRNRLTASSDRDYTQGFGESVQTVAVPTITLTDLLTQLRITHIDLLSVDVELSEPQLLAGFDIERFRPTLVCIEAVPDVRQRILNYFAKHGYVTVGAYLRVDVQNLYFIPLNAVGNR